MYALLQNYLHRQRTVFSGVHITIMKASRESAPYRIDLGSPLKQTAANATRGCAQDQPHCAVTA